MRKSGRKLGMKWHHLGVSELFSTKHERMVTTYRYRPIPSHPTIHLGRQTSTQCNISTNRQGLTSSKQRQRQSHSVFNQNQVNKFKILIDAYLTSPSSWDMAPSQMTMTTINKLAKDDDDKLNLPCAAARRWPQPGNKRRDAGKRETGDGWTWLKL